VRNHCAATRCIPFPHYCLSDPASLRTHLTRLTSQVVACRCDYACDLRLPEVFRPSTVTQTMSSFAVPVWLSHHLRVVALHLTTCVGRKTLRNPAFELSTFDKDLQDLTTALTSLQESVSQTVLVFALDD
jgi:hypothetical protein